MIKPNYFWQQQEVVMPIALKSFRTVGVFGFILLTSVAGCGRGNRPTTTPVTLTITYQGKPVDGATVTLVPESSSVPVATGVTDNSGVVKPRTFPDVSGVLPGSYTVTVRKTEAQGTVPEGQSLDDLPPGQGPTFRELLPTKYGSPSTSGLKLTVPERGTLSEKFDLTD